MTGGEAVAATLVRLGVRHVFGIVSVHNLPTFDALSLRDDIEVVTVRHEQAAAHAADAYSRATGELSVVLTSTGPGAANAVAGLYEAGFVSSKVLMITGQIESRFYGKGKGYLHEHERQVDMLRSVCRRVDSVRYAEEISRVVAAVADDIRTGRPQPGAVEIPIDLQYREVEIELFGEQTVPRIQPDPLAIADATALLEGAERPLIWAGGGVNIAGASTELTALAERLNAPVLTTIEGRGAIDETHELALGFRSDRPAMAEIIEECDVMLAVGTRFQNYATRVWSLKLPDNLVHLDVDPGVIDRNYKAAIPVVGDALVGLEQLLAGLKGGNADEGFVDRARKLKAADEQAVRDEIGPDHNEICNTIRRLLPANGRIARDSTVPNYMWGNRLLPIVQSRTSIRAASSAIGPGLPHGIGAAVGSGEPTVVIQGDGGFMLSIGELVTAAEHHLPIIVCLFNDQGYGVLRVIQDQVLGHRHGTDLHTPDFVQVAEGMGVASERVVGVEQFEAAFQRALDRAINHSSPSLLDIDMNSLTPLTFALPAHQRRKQDR
jgi:acetolactate synthase-1/2/3 large subunit